MLPQLFLDRMKQMLEEEYPAFLNSYEDARYQALRINPSKTDTDRFTEETSFHLQPVPWEANGFYYEKEDQPGKHPYHEAGVYYIQEPSAMAPAAYLDAQPGEKVLDLCAAPGGKSTQIAAAMQGKGLLVSNEIHPARAKILSENIERMGIRNAMVTNESPQALASVFTEYFDRIMVDAPCSGEGMFRKNEQACDEWSPENVKTCAARQQEILSCAASMLRPGGRIVYSTCTFAPEENEGTIAR
jgi:NOL1/NOP2/sun family putative RNA methylase